MNCSIRSTIILVLAASYTGPNNAQVDTSAVNGTMINSTDSGELVSVFKDFHGMLDAKGRTQLEANGYRIVLEHHDWPSSHAAYSKTMKKALPKSSMVGQDVDGLPFPNLIHRLLRSGEGDNAVKTFYCVPDKHAAYWVIGFATIGDVDDGFERSVVIAVHNNGGYSGLMTGYEAPEIDFCGRIITLGPACHWMGPHNCQCSGLGQMNWYMVGSPERAAELTHAQLKRTQEDRAVIRKDTVEVVFEGTETMAIRVTYKLAKVLRAMGVPSDRLVAYYVSVPVRGRYVSCILSHYGDPAPDRSLPPLLSEVMTLR